MLKSAYYAGGAALATVQKHRPIGRNIYRDADEWDICVVLDSARWDMFHELAADRFSLPEEQSRWSVGSITTEWLSNTFRPRYAPDIGETALVTATPHSQTVFGDKEWLTNQSEVGMRYPRNPVVDKSDFAAVHELWRSHATVENVVPPETMLDATLEAWESSERVVAHWMQPHEPFIAPNARLVGGGATEKNVWSALNAGELRPEDVWQSYRATLDYALESLDVLLSCVNARVLITADHGNMFGEMGMYGHPFGLMHPAVRKVPWHIVNGVDIVDRERASVLKKSGQSTDIEEQLVALGYR